MSWLSCQPKLVAQRISSDVPNGLVPLNQRPPSAVPQRSAVGCLGRESVVATVHARCVGPWDPLVACWVPLTPSFDVYENQAACGFSYGTQVCPLYLCTFHEDLSSCPEPTDRALPS